MAIQQLTAAQLKAQGFSLKSTDTITPSNQESFALPKDMLDLDACPSIKAQCLPVKTGDETWYAPPVGWKVESWESGKEQRAVWVTPSGAFLDQSMCSLPKSNLGWFALLGAVGLWLAQKGGK